ncbi:hypothetical protein F753_04985 [Stutzerimonas chloritidismutans AW-1]|uniref:Uncharacterized protein n=1 Tax=Stutzerimonas chloritidismutans AW-1 TaxID=1263865 RepID=V4QCU7_STUCH|nr:hypothetical protein F753_04985 [Stutzerimonas chloritidismutans AW-1]
MDIDKAAQALSGAERILIITGAGLSADSGLPTYRGLGGLYNGETEDGLPIEVALSGPTLRCDPALCWKYLAEIGRAAGPACRPSPMPATSPSPSCSGANPGPGCSRRTSMASTAEPAVRLIA